jgi:signal transduction histidine kinase
MRRSHELISSFKKVAVDQSVEEKRIFKVKTYIQEILTSMHPQLKNAGHIIDVECSPLIQINGYPGTLYQIISNLVMNSLKHGFTENKKGIISIHVKKLEKELELVFSDNGCGIPEQDQKHIFEPFFTTKRSQGGTGLGLNLVYNLVKHKLEGNISFKSKKQEGTTFFITFPVEYVEP